MTECAKSPLPTHDTSRMPLLCTAHAPTSEVRCHRTSGGNDRGARLTNCCSQATDGSFFGVVTGNRFACLGELQEQRAGLPVRDVRQKFLVFGLHKISDKGNGSGVQHHSIVPIIDAGVLLAVVNNNYARTRMHM